MNRRGLTFRDVSLVPDYCGQRTRGAVDTGTFLGRRIPEPGILYQGAAAASLTLRIPIISANMDTITGAQMARKMAELGGLGILHRFMPIDKNVDEFKRASEPIYHQHPAKPAGVIMAVTEYPVGVSIGVNEGMNRAEALRDAGATIFCVDVAHGHSKLTGQTVKKLREMLSDNGLIIAGNVATHAGADYLASCGADVIKVGIGPGSVCTTRVKTGFGVPQLTAIMDCSKVDRPIIADGGCREPGDVVKALAAGADAVMLGGMLAGTDETPGDTIDGCKVFRGMASAEAYKDFFGEDLPEWKTAEGVTLTVDAIGSVEVVIHDIVGGLRSGLTYCGASNIRDLQRRAEFIEITPAAYAEGLPHGLK